MLLMFFDGFLVMVWCFVCALLFFGCWAVWALLRCRLIEVGVELTLSIVVVPLKGAL